LRKERAKERGVRARGGKQRKRKTTKENKE
jgi:hypothetical protein